ncbi:MAG: DUF2096 family protein [Candidatus Bathyarchaeota archaeon]|nr:DUF2096 family protein [Candidatus Bathyarchaeota archaeon]
MGSNLASWKLLEDMMLELKKSGIDIPTKVVEDLRTAKSLIELACTEGSHGDSLHKAEEYLANVEAYIVNEGEKVFGTEKVDDWLRKLEAVNASCCPKPSKVKAEEKFVTGVPRDQKWVRVEPMGEWSKEKIHQIAKAQNLQIMPQKDGKLVVHGQAEDLKTFVKKMAAEKTKPA